MIFSTETGSTYEVDLVEARVRRLSNLFGQPATSCFGSDGEWRSYLAITLWRHTEADVGIMFWWDESAPHDFTRTSAVVVTDESRKLLDSLEETAWRLV